MKTSRLKVASYIAQKTLADKTSSKELSKEIAAYLLQNRRVGELESLLRDVELLWAEAGHVEVVATTSHPLSTDNKNEIKSEAKSIYPAAKTININEIIDESLLANIRLNIINKRLDLSAKASLNRFRQLTGAGVSK
jgi:F0F1-type ATP synthase delta subunit